MTPLSYRFLKALAIGGAASLVLGACGGGTSSGGLAANQTLKFPLLDDYATLDPAIADAETDQEIGQNLFNGLVKFDNNLNVVPDIASKMPDVSPDGLTYTFTLRQDVKFWNGDKVTSKDVLYSWNRAASMSGAYGTSYGGNLSPITGYSPVSKQKAVGAALESLLEKSDPSVILTGLTAPDPYTVVAKLSSPAGWWLSAIALTDSTGMIVDQNAVKQDFDNWWSNPATAVGTGPYKMISRTPKQSEEFAAVSNWWGSPKPTVTKVHIDILQSAASAITAYEQGSYDLYGYGGWSQAAGVADIKRIQATSSESAQLVLQPKVRTTWVSFNMISDGVRAAKGPFTLAGGQAAHDLRMAFALAVDKQKLAQVVCGNILCLPATGGIITKGLTGYLGDNADPLGAFDVAKAKALLASADPTGTKTKGLTYAYDPETPVFKDSAVFLQDQWQTNLGVHVDLLSVSHHAFIQARLAGKYVITRDGWQADYNHPQDWFSGLYGTALGCPDSGCTSGYTTPAFDALLAKANAEPLTQALPDYQALSQMLISDVVYIPLFYSVGAFLIKPYVKGAGTNNFVDYPWNGIQINSH
ncbi:MAG: peptide ABC transporter substrate-binding protein [Candidatus Dormibacteraeota bacterium]|nr:peptide ABC transporter substrate-binding protein [Candidatus Dormibacteraeota bacterium]